ncbi:UDP-2,4-diacetamido-2,4,6-trideoxy-beta-L-altropyranose hydrolase [Billgrantia bachuensis]|uniref:UDP-2,4-diacetamido-2,4, 6-trideoxy-beta-L-altropyranose hydrolase n=1 Tax=Billgrantia bachuensis TaxID=2717286 RepID=UPI00197F2D8E
MSYRPDANRGKVVAIRADASLEIGTGHVMRCLTLARALRGAGTECHFLCREHPGNLTDMIQSDGFVVHRLPLDGHDDPGQFLAHPYGSNGMTEHSHWLGVHWQADAEECRTILEELTPDWLIVDHYALNACWERAVLPQGTRLMVIDDLADRSHIADILLDQNLGRNEKDYENLVPARCRCLIGPRYALLRPEFVELREASLDRRREPFEPKQLLISLGGVDKDNATGAVLDALKSCGLPGACHITVIMGASAPWLDTVRTKAGELPWHCDVVVNVTDMARRMTQADLAIGAAGSTSWERCCLGVPTLMLELADNQKGIAEALHQVGAAYNVGKPDAVNRLPDILDKQIRPKTLARMSRIASGLVDGNGLTRLVKLMTTESHQEEVPNG